MTDLEVSLARAVASAASKSILSGEHAVVHGHAAVATALEPRTTVEVVPLPGSDVVQVSSVVGSRVSVAAWDLSMLKSANLASAFSLDLEADPPAKAFNDELDRIFRESSHSLAQTTQSEITQALLKSNNAADEQKDGAATEVSELPRASCLVFLYLYHMFTSARVGLSCIVRSEIPFGGGLGSSAGYSAALTTALFAMEAKRCEGFEKLDFRGKQALVPDSRAQKLLNKWSFEAERILHGSPSGIDNAISVFGGTIRFQHHKEIQHLSQISKHLQILVVNTGVTRNTNKLVAGVKDLQSQLPAIVQKLFETCGLVSDRVFEILSTSKDWSEEEAETVGNELGELFRINQHTLASVRVSHRAIDEIVRIGAKHGLHCKLTGAGGGGCVIAFVTANRDLAPLKLELEQSGGYKAFVSKIGQPGVLVHEES